MSEVGTVRLLEKGNLDGYLQKSVVDRLSFHVFDVQFQYGSRL